VLRSGIGVLLMPAIRFATTADLPAVRALLIASGLPVDDLDAAPIELLVAEAQGALVGVVGMESAGNGALLRSLAVRPDLRSTGLGQALVSAIEARARDLAIPSLVLLTTTAADYFDRRGYRRITRDEVPDGVRATAEFRHLCPASAACMSKTIGSTA
jgi:amino-acid N-acetyltransferase